jgi:Iap family predicted aminopeptidase
METKFNFKSAVCTSREQSEKLLALGLKGETADCVWLDHALTDDYDDWRSEPIYKDWEGWQKNGIPAWSLHRLLCLYGQDYEIKELYNSAEECYGMLITAIGRAIENEEFNEEYLNNGVYTH